MSLEEDQLEIGPSGSGDGAWDVGQGRDGRDQDQQVGGGQPEQVAVHHALQLGSSQHYQVD